MRPWMLSAAAIAVALGLGACEREVKTVETNRTIVQPGAAPEKETVKEKETVVIQPETVKEKETVVVQPAPGPAGPAGPAGPQGPQGEPGKPGGDTIVVVPPAQKQ